MGQVFIRRWPRALNELYVIEHAAVSRQVSSQSISSGGAGVMSTPKQKQSAPVGGAPVTAKEKSAAATAVRTPWGQFQATPKDQQTRDPLEPDAPATPAQAAAAAAKKRTASTEPAPLSPRELYEML